ncbi:MAG: hypothetical protein K5705_04610 [Oscillospiraceae bacterium]|nr:hypothetical protein [Oscillospiraceae bacterium]
MRIDKFFMMLCIACLSVVGFFKAFLWKPLLSFFGDVASGTLGNYIAEKMKSMKKPCLPTRRKTKRTKDDVHVIEPLMPVEDKPPEKEFLSASLVTEKATAVDTQAEKKREDTYGLKPKSKCTLHFQENGTVDVDFEQW